MLKKVSFLTAAAAATLTLGMNPTASAEVLIGWHSVDDVLAPNNSGDKANDATPDTVVAGISGVLGTGAVAGGRGGFEVRSNANSTDGTYGTVDIPGSPITANAVFLRTSSNDQQTLDVSIRNDGAVDLRLDLLSFDYTRLANGPTTLNLVLLGDASDLDASEPFPNVFSTTSIPEGTLIGNYLDADADLAVLSDRTLATGEEAIFRFNASNASGQFAGLLIDNVAFSGAFVPEPASLVLVGLGGLLLIGRGRRSAC